MFSTSMFIVLVPLAVLILIESQIAVGRQMIQVKVETQARRK
jgi:hypothetical protein